ncbi:hypothetical protein KABACHOK_02070 [Brevundimonas phage vB_BpoS-Kabachok]|uniref:Uncharacterized protein n=1 Tax=Brevundimonas phage vB_BpoS-Kabachok TaxID=2948600 RepID=A0A9E7MP56_9CAUD|nr:hypothetical protein KABACHOK_02070 [Brevundimonas phage vB_BpoS-Kabachok]
MPTASQIAFRQQLQAQQRERVVRYLGGLRKGSVAPAAEIALMMMAVHDSHAMERDSLGLYNVMGQPRDADGAFREKSFSAATIQKLVRAGRVEVVRFNINGVPLLIKLKPM